MKWDDKPGEATPGNLRETQKVRARQVHKYWKQDASNADTELRLTIHMRQVLNRDKACSLLKMCWVVVIESGSGKNTQQPHNSKQ